MDSWGIVRASTEMTYNRPVPDRTRSPSFRSNLSAHESQIKPRHNELNALFGTQGNNYRINVAIANVCVCAELLISGGADVNIDNA